MTNNRRNNGKAKKIKSSHVRLTEAQLLRLQKDQVVTAKSIPELLKSVYFKKARFRPVLDTETRKAVTREMAYMGNNLNQLTKAIHTFGMIEEYQPRINQLQEDLAVLRSYLKLSGDEPGPHPERTEAEPSSDPDENMV